MPVLLLGDSHLDYIDTRRLRAFAEQLGDEVENDAVGGSCATDLRSQGGGRDLTAYAAVVVSVATNDASPWLQMTKDAFVGALEEFVTGNPGARLVYVGSPGIREDLFGFFGTGANEELAAYSAAGARVVEAAGGVTVRTREVLAPLGADAFLEDGVHLTGAAYDVLLPAVAAAIGGLSSGR